MDYETVAMGQKTTGVLERSDMEITRKKINELRKTIYLHSYDMAEYPVRMKSIVGWIHDALEYDANPCMAIARQDLLENFRGATQNRHRKFEYVPMRVKHGELFLLDTFSIEDMTKQIMVSNLIPVGKDGSVRIMRRWDDIPERAKFYPCKCGMGGMWLDRHEDGVTMHVDVAHEARAIMMDGRFRYCIECGEKIEG